ncbi:MAG: bifunctional UDP-N-acetylmuramoyl-L-alanyl-D-glutamate--2,6-diaminopimelate ligase MurE/UDP-N-acetylmuramoyl-tripeptide--D-alanyl-D-alanine ligase MurF [Caldimonas sp.]
MAAGAVTTLDSREAAHAWLLVRQASALVGDSRRVTPGDAFVAWPGYATDARRHVPGALVAGAAACLVEAEGVEAFDFANESRVAAMRGLKAAAGDIASRFLGVPSKRLDVIAITGTNGKTSTAWWVAQALGAIGRRSGVIGTLGVGEPPAADATNRSVATGLLETGLLETGMTTPDPIILQTALADFAARGFASCAIEASSIGIAEHRLAGTRVACAVFTNFTQDHLDYHGDMAAYWQAKAQLFAWPGLKSAVVNLDDAQGVELAATLAGGPIDAWTVSTHVDARLRASAIRYGKDGLAFDVHEGAERVSISTPLIGDYNVSNLLATIGVLRALGIGLQEAAEACASLTPVPGRMQRVGSSDSHPEVVVDYAHTPDALEKALAALRPLAAERGGKLWCVFGCGGNRDASKRPLMGAIAVKRAEHVVVTSDNPRLESPDFILSQIMVGAIGHDEVDVIENRAQAIRHAVTAASPADVVLIAGKGHEDYQDVGGVKHPFSDMRHAADALAARGEPLAPFTAASPMFTLADAARLIPGARVVGDPSTTILRVHSDTRTLTTGDLFVALRGDRFDGHDFLAQARIAGAVAALADHGLEAAGLAGLEVADTRVSLGALAAGWRSLAGKRLPLVAVTGSNGKTTVTQMIGSIFRAWRGDMALATQGNFNNDIGLPLTLLRLRYGHPARAHRVAVVELGMNHPGEIARLAAIAAPSVVLVNNAQREHLEFMASVEAVARENGSAIDALAADGTAVFPADDEHSSIWRSLAGPRRVLTFGEGASADVSGEAAWSGDHWTIALRSPAGSASFALHIAGRHNVRNAFAAAASAIAAGCPLEAVARGLESFRPVRGRSQLLRKVVGGVERTLVDDTYNANPDSVRAAIDVLADLPAPRWLVLGDMGEVGTQGPAFHREAGAYASERGVETLWAAGAESPNTVAGFAGARAFANVEALVAELGSAPAFASVLIKGSRFMRMERVVAALVKEPAGDPHAA